MDYDKLTNLLAGEGVSYAEVTIYQFSEESGQLTKKTITIDYYGDGDYQWSTSFKPLKCK